MTAPAINTTLENVSTAYASEALLKVRGSSLFPYDQFQFHDLDWHRPKHLETE